MRLEKVTVKKPSSKLQRLRLRWSPTCPWKRGRHDDVIKWKHFPRYWPFVRGIHRSPVNSPHKGQWRGALMFSLICTRINGWVNNGEAGDLKRRRAHYDVTVMIISLTYWRWEEIDAISQTTFCQCIIINETIGISINISLNLLRRVNLTIFQHWFR